MQNSRPQNATKNKKEKEEEDAASAAVRPEVPRAEDDEFPETEENRVLPYA